MKLHRIAQVMMLVGLAVSVTSAGLAYGLESQLSMSLVIALHIGCLIGPALIKFGYVAKLSASHQLAHGL